MFVVYKFSVDHANNCECIYLYINIYSDAQLNDELIDRLNYRSDSLIEGTFQDEVSAAEKEHDFCEKISWSENMSKFNDLL